METGTKICRVCGKEYPCCGGSRPNTSGTFRYKDVACSPECGTIWLERIAASRGEKVQKAVEPKAVPVMKIEPEPVAQVSVVDVESDDIFGDEAIEAEAIAAGITEADGRKKNKKKSEAEGEM